MKIRFLKDHGFNTANTEADLPDAAANYLIRVGVAEEVTDEEYTDEVLSSFVERAKEKEEKELGAIGGIGWI